MAESGRNICNWCGISGAYGNSICCLRNNKSEEEVVM